MLPHRCEARRPTTRLLTSALSSLGPRRPAKRLLTTSVGASGSPALHAFGGTLFFVAAERGTAALLDAFDVRLPASVTALCALGCCVTVPSLGTPLQATLGPAAAWLRAALPWLTAPAFLCPAVVELPERDALPRLALLAAGGVIVTCAAAGHLTSAFAQVAAPSVKAPCAQAAAAAAAAFSSPRVALAALGVGMAASLALHVGGPSDAAAVVRGPAYAGLTLALYVAAARSLPDAVRKFCPPNVGCALVLLPLLLGLGGVDEVRVYLHGAGAALLWAVQPAMVTLGLYAFTHRALFVQQRFALLGLAAAAPAMLFGVAWTGAALGLEPQHVASVLPASTTTGLALTMPSGMPLIQLEWVAAGSARQRPKLVVSGPRLLECSL